MRRRRFDADPSLPIQPKLNKLGKAVAALFDEGMARAELERIVRYADAILKTSEFEDWPGAVNGLQAQNNGSISKIAAAVDGTLATLRLAAAEGADLLIVHHGLFWSPAYPWTGKRHDMLRLLFENNIAVYSSHLPLDAHPVLGNNASICAGLGLQKLEPFFFEKGRHIGFQSKRTIDRDALGRALEKILGGPVRVAPGGPQTCRRIGVVSGGAGEQLRKAKDEGVDTFITGEGPHWSFALAEELGLNVFYGGHYATETFGVKALAEHLSKRFKLSWTFLDHPSGL